MFILPLFDTDRFIINGIVFDGVGIGGSFEVGLGGKTGLLTWVGFGGKGGAIFVVGEWYSIILSIWSIQVCNIDNNATEFGGFDTIAIYTNH